MFRSESKQRIGRHRELHTERVRKLYSSPNNLLRCDYQINEDEIVEIRRTNEENEKSIQSFVEKPEEEPPLGCPRHRWDNHVKILILK
jgi:hypothetical protein